MYVANQASLELLLLAMFISFSCPPTCGGPYQLVSVSRRMTGIVMDTDWPVRGVQRSRHVRGNPVSFDGPLRRCVAHRSQPRGVANPLFLFVKTYRPEMGSPTANGIPSFSGDRVQLPPGSQRRSRVAISDASSSPRRVVSTSRRETHCSSSVMLLLGVQELSLHLNSTSGLSKMNCGHLERFLLTTKVARQPKTLCNLDCGVSTHLK